jgi:asparagine synthetase B (glutamine-hydrolysing)
MNRLNGRYCFNQSPIEQTDYQIEPFRWTSLEGYKLPICGPYTQVVARHGECCLYVSQPGEVPLYYSITPGWIHWHEQKLALPGKPNRIEQGTAIIWSPESLESYFVEHLPRPNIGTEILTQSEAIAHYQQILITAVLRRLGNAKRIAVAQSGGPDSLLITWALTQCGVQVIPLTVCTSEVDLDIQGARSACSTLGLSVIPIVVCQDQLAPLIQEALLCCEDTEDSNVRMAIGNLLMARKCQELEIDLIFSGHGHDDVFGKGTLVKGVLNQQVGSSAERWRDTRWLCTMATRGMLKMFSSTFRRYGVQVRMPYYDADLLEWAFSQPVEVLPIEFKKQFVHQVFRQTLPPGTHTDPKYSIGYLTGAGLSLRNKTLKAFFNPKRLRQQLKQLQQLPLDKRIFLSH